MSGNKEFSALIDLIYEAALDNDLWPGVLIKLADAMGAAQVAMPSLDRRANLVSNLAPRLDPDLFATYTEHWAFRDPLLGRAMLRPKGEILTVDGLMPREEFSATPVFNEWYRRAGLGLAAVGANVVAEDGFSALICFFNPPSKDTLTSEQARLFEAMLSHIGRAVRIHRQLWKLELKNLALPERFENLPQGALLADASARVVLANAGARAMLDAGDGILLRDGRLAAAGDSHVLHKLIASCARTSPALGGPGGELKVPRDLRRPPFQV